MGVQGLGYFALDLHFLAIRHGFIYIYTNIVCYKINGSLQ